MNPFMIRFFMTKNFYNEVLTGWFIIIDFAACTYPVDKRFYFGCYSLQKL